MYRSCIFCSAHLGRDETLKAARREAEAIGDVADVLPGDPLDRIPGR